MVKVKVLDAVPGKNRIKLTVQPLEGNIKGKIRTSINGETLSKMLNGRPPTPAALTITARRLKGTTLEMPLFGQESKKDRRKRLRKEGLWKMKEDKMQIDYVMKKYEEKEPAYSTRWEDIEGLETVQYLEELSENKIVLFKKKEAKRIEVIKEIEQVEWVNHVKSARKLEIR